MFSWSDFLVLAKKLIESPNEAELRTAIGRAYYSVFHASKDFCQMSGTVIPTQVRGKKASVHLGVINALLNHGDNRVSSAGRFLDSLRSWRDDADYKQVLNWDVGAKAKTANIQADKILSLLSDALKP